MVPYHSIRIGGSIASTGIRARHIRFMEDGEIYCVGIVFDLKDLA
jgi:hypothetical protein